MDEEVIDILVGDPVSALSELEAKQNTCGLGCNPDGPGFIAGILGFLGLGGFLAFFSNFFGVIWNLFAGLL